MNPTLAMFLDDGSLSGMRLLRDEKGKLVTQWTRTSTSCSTRSSSSSRTPRRGGVRERGAGHRPGGRRQVGGDGERARPEEGLLQRLFFLSSRRVPRPHLASKNPPLIWHAGGRRLRRLFSN